MRSIASSFSFTNRNCFMIRCWFKYFCNGCNQHDKNVQVSHDFTIFENEQFETKQISRLLFSLYTNRREETINTKPNRKHVDENRRLIHHVGWMIHTAGRHDIEWVICWSPMVQTGLSARPHRTFKKCI